MRDDRPIFAVFCVLILIIGCLYTRCLRYKKAALSTPVRDTLTVHDTVPFYYPKPRDSVVIRYDTIWGLSQAPSTPPEGELIATSASLSSPPRGEIVGAIPITSKTYEGDGWRAHVSGFRPSLDSLLLFPERQVITIRDPPASTASRSRRWALGVQAGYGLTPRGMQPYVGVGLSWHFNF